MSPTLGAVTRMFLSSRDRVVRLVLVAALAGGLVGMTSLLFISGVASADPLEKVPADFTVSPGQTIQREYTKPMVNSAELRPDPDGCRHNPAIGLTCVVHRIQIPKIVPGYFLRISTSWTSEGNEVGTSVPDIDTYLFADTSGYLDYNTIGGVSGAMPEAIKLVDVKQNEYDFVAGVYAGAVEGYTLVVQYVNEAVGPSPAAPDITLTPKAAPVIKQVTSPMVGATGQPVLYAVVKQNPDACRNDPTKAALCDVYRLKLNRNRSKDATNFVVVTLEWQARNLTPDLVLGVAGLEAIQDPNLDMFVWDSSSHVMERGQVGGESGSVPERVSFVATQDEYDLVVQIANGANSAYKLTARMTDESFDKPFELLDPITGQPVSGAIPDGSGGYVSPVDGTVVASPLALAPIDDDAGISGIGLGTTEQFDNQNALELGAGTARNTASTAKPPAAWVLWLALLVLPTGVTAAGVIVMRRRHNVAF